MNLLFIGASGFVGRHAMALARKEGHRVFGTQSAARHPGLLKFDLLTDRIKDCLPPDLMSGGPVFGVVCASVRQIDQCLRERETTYQVNVVRTLTLIDDLLALGITPVFLSTSYVFDGRVGYYTESHAYCPVCEYGRHKAAVEAHLVKEHPELFVLRLDKIVGDDPAEDHLFSEWMKWLRAGQPITCIAGQVLSPTSADDIGRALLLGCERGLKGLYNTANPEFFSREELARQFLATLGLKAEIVSKPQEQFQFLDPRPTKTYLDSTKFIRATGMNFTSMREVMVSFAHKALAAQPFTHPR